MSSADLGQWSPLSVRCRTSATVERRAVLSGPPTGDRLRERPADRRPNVLGYIRESFGTFRTELTYGNGQSVLVAFHSLRASLAIALLCDYCD